MLGALPVVLYRARPSTTSAGKTAAIRKTSHVPGGELSQIADFTSPQKPSANAAISDTEVYANRPVLPCSKVSWNKRYR